MLLTDTDEVVNVAHHKCARLREGLVHVRFSKANGLQFTKVVLSSMHFGDIAQAAIIGIARYLKRHSISMPLTLVALVLKFHDGLLVFV
ncbi:hypothetical protein BG61_31950 [Caballeronia glathei]|uniref:Uncharacterized protein n=1 Tax=Caballeronia glathei TaxID=60547 RepID=A0A069PHX3_9BURK|nr:hypothetical protein BG61_31950 [Caballeronia glathei]